MSFFHNVKGWIVLASLGLAATAEAGPFADALAKADIKAMHARREELPARCTLGAIYAKKADLPRAHFWLLGCDGTLPDEISDAVAKASRDVEKKLKDSNFSSIDVEGKAGLTAEIDAFPGERFAIPSRIWVKAGTYEVKATDGESAWSQTVNVGEHSHASPYFDAVKPKVAPPKTIKMDFDHDNAAEKQEAGPPPDLKHKNMVPDKYRKKTAEPGTAIEDPLEMHHTTREPNDLWLGVRLGAGMFDDGAASARAGGAIAIAGRYRFASPYFISGRFDWSRRGGDAPSSLDVLGASAGAGMTLVDGTIGVALIAQLRGDLRLASEREMSTVNRVGVSAAANLELTLPSTPITAGLRFEQGLTELVPGARDRALLVEVGVDWR